MSRLRARHALLIATLTALAIHPAPPEVEPLTLRLRARFKLPRALPTTGAPPR